MGFTWRWVAVWLVLMVPAWSSAQPTDPAPINLVTEEWPPYNYEAEGALSGVSVKLVQAIQALLGRADPIRLYPSMRAAKILQTHPRTMMFSMFRTPARESHYKWIGPIGRDAIYFYQRPGRQPPIRTLEEAKAVPLIACRQAGLVYNTLVAADFGNLDATAYNSRQVYGKLLLGRADLAISDSPLGVRYLLRQLGLPENALQQTQVRLVASDLYIAASLDFSDAEIARWQAALEKIKAAGIYDAIYQDLD